MSSHVASLLKVGQCIGNTDRHGDPQGISPLTPGWLPGLVTQAESQWALRLLYCPVPAISILLMTWNPAFHPALGPTNYVDSPTLNGMLIPLLLFWVPLRYSHLDQNSLIIGIRAAGCVQWGRALGNKEPVSFHWLGLF